jgi:hypothetical protein
MASNRILRRHLTFSRVGRRFRLYALENPAAIDTRVAECAVAISSVVHQADDALPNSAR